MKPHLPLRIDLIWRLVLLRYPELGQWLAVVSSEVVLIVGRAVRSGVDLVTQTLDDRVVAHTALAFGRLIILRNQIVFACGRFALLLRLRIPSGLPVVSEITWFRWAVGERTRERLVGHELIDAL